MDSSPAPKPQPKPRISLTRSQLQEPAALDLLALLQTVTSDGKLTKEEIQLLQQWLEEHRTSLIPAIQHLIGAVDTALADGRITDQEREWLQKAVETVLPREQRELAVLRRRERVSDERQQKAEFERKSKPLASFDFMVAGVFHEGRQQIIAANVTVEDTVFLVRDPRNQYSRSATAIRLKNGFEIGWVPENEAARLAPMLDQGARHAATIKKIIRGGRGPIPVVWGELYSQDCPLAYTVGQSDLPESRRLQGGSTTTTDHPASTVPQPNAPSPTLTPPQNAVRVVDRESQPTSPPNIHKIFVQTIIGVVGILLLIVLSLRSCGPI